MKKWLSNFWYHYKFRTILCLFFAIIIIVTIIEYATNERYDISVYLYTSEEISSDVERSLEMTIEEVYRQNGEEKNVRIIDLSYSPYADEDSRMAHASALLSELRVKKSYLFITDEYRLNEFITNEKTGDVFGKQTYFNKNDGRSASLKGSEFEKKFSKSLSKNNVSVIQMPEYFVSLITPPKKDSSDRKVYSDCEKLAKLMID